MEGEVKGEMVPHFLVQSDANVSVLFIVCTFVLCMLPFRQIKLYILC